MKQTVLVGAAGGSPAAKVAQVDGIELLASFGDPRSEYQAMTQTAGIVDLGFRRRLTVKGADRVSFLHAMLSNDIESMSPGQGCHALLLTVQGKVVADAIVLVEAGRVILDTVAGRALALAEGLDRYLVADDVKIEPVGEADHAVGIFGPASRQALSLLLGEDVGLTEPYRFREAEHAGLNFHMVCLPEPGCGGFMLVVASEDVGSLWDCLVATGAEGGVRPAGFDAYNSLRLESGLPWCGIDMGEDTIALEAQLERAISFDKGCYLGQEVIERISSRGQVNRRLTGLVLSGPGKPEAGARLVVDGEEVGWITSAGFSYRLGSPFALGYVRRNYWEDGNKLSFEQQVWGSATVKVLPV